MTYTRPDGGETRDVNTVDMVRMCQTVLYVVPDESRVTSETDTAHIEELDIEGFCLWPNLWNEEDSSMSSAGLKVDFSLCMSEQDNLSYVHVASMGDFNGVVSDDAIGFDSVDGSVAELEWNTWDDACAWEFRNASGNFPPDSELGLPAVLLKDVVYCKEDGRFLEWDVCCTRIYTAVFVLAMGYG